MCYEDAPQGEAQETQKGSTTIPLTDSFKLKDWENSHCPLPIDLFDEPASDEETENEDMSSRPLLTQTATTLPTIASNSNGASARNITSEEHLDFGTFDGDFASQTQRNPECAQDTDCEQPPDHVERDDDNHTGQAAVQPNEDSRGNAANMLMENARLARQQEKQTYLSNLRRSSRYDFYRCPFFKRIPGTDFIVDGFQWASPQLSRHYFLTHFHADHYQGLSKHFNCGTIYCSITTARLAHRNIGIPTSCFKTLPLNEFVEINGVRVAFIDANHCPGAVMILFVLSNGKSYLHVGDFRWHEVMKHHPLLRQFRAFAAHTLNGLFLDTTYCKPQYKFPLQNDSIDAAVELASQYAEDKGVLFVFGSYSIGKERIWKAVAKYLQCYVYVSNRRLEMIQCYENTTEEDRKLLTTDPTKARIHVLPMQQVSLIRLSAMLQRLRKQYRESTAEDSENVCQSNGNRRMDKYLAQTSKQGPKSKKRKKEKNLAAKFARLKELSTDISPANTPTGSVDAQSFIRLSKKALEADNGEFQGFHSIVAFRPTGWTWDSVSNDTNDSATDGVTEDRAPPVAHVSTSLGSKVAVTVSKRNGGAKAHGSAITGVGEQLEPTQLRETQQNTQVLEENTNSRRKKQRRESRGPKASKIGATARRGGITLYGIPYSEHSSFTELQDCVNFFQPQTIVPTVNCRNSAEAEETVRQLRGSSSCL